MNWYRYHPQLHRLTLTLHIQPDAQASATAGLHGDALKLRIAAPAADDRANAAVIDFLHEWFKLPAGRIKIKHGSRGRRKIVELDHPAAGFEALLARLCIANSNNA